MWPPIWKLPVDARLDNLSFKWKKNIKVTIPLSFSGRPPDHRQGDGPQDEQAPQPTQRSRHPEPTTLSLHLIVLVLWRLYRRGEQHAQGAAAYELARPQKYS